MITHDTFTLERTYDCSIEHLYEAWADPAIKAKWFAGPEGWTELERKTDFRVGGVEISHGRHVSNFESKFVSTYHQIVPNERLVFVYDMYVNGTMLSVTLATAEFVPSRRSAKLRYTEQSIYFDAPDGAASRKKGTEQLFDQISRAL